MSRVVSGQIRQGGYRRGFCDWLATLFILFLFLPKQVAVPLGPLDITPLQMSSLALMAAFVAGGLQFRWPDGLMLAVFVQRFFAHILKGDFGIAFENIGKQFIEFAGAYLLGRYLAIDRGRLWTHVRLLIALLAVLSVVALWECISFVNPHALLWGLPSGRGGGVNVYRMGMLRALGWTSHPIILGTTYLAVLPIACFAALSDLRLLGAFGKVKIAALFLGIFCSLSTGPWVGAVILVGLIVLDRYTKTQSDRKWVVLMIVVVIPYLFLEMASNKPIIAYLMMKLHLSDPGSAYYRYTLYGRVFAAMPGSWWWGHGSEMTRYFKPVYGNSSVDNHYLVLLLRYGLLGLGLWLSMMATGVLYLRRAVWLGGNSTGAAQLARFTRMGIVALAILQLSVDLFSTAPIMCWMLIGITISLPHQVQPNLVRPASRRPGVTPSARNSRAVRSVPGVKGVGRG